MELVPMFDNVIVKHDQTLGKTPGGIVLPENSKEQPKQGIVIAVGPGAMSGTTVVPTQVKKEDRVLFHAFSGQELFVGEENLLVLKETEILAILKD